MAGIRVLHISDLHFSEKIEQDVSIVLNSLLSHATDELEQVDLLIFSGDIAFSGTPKEFNTAKTEFIQKLLTALNLTPDNLILCPGNHDIDRNIVRKYPYVQAGLLQTLQSRSDINGFVDEHWTANVADLPPPFQRLKEYYALESSLQGRSIVFSNLFLTVSRMTIGAHDVGVAAFNTAWLSSGEPNNADMGQLVLGERVVDRAVSLLTNCDLRFAVFHHPLHWMNPADEAAVESRLQSEFDLLFCGHIHRATPSKSSTIHGDAILSQAGCLYQSRDYFNGYNLIEQDFEKSEIRVLIREYSDERRTFLPATRVVGTD